MLGSTGVYQNADMDAKNVTFSLCQHHGPHPVVTDEISEMNKSRREKMRRADIGARSGMAQVPIEFETDL